MASTTSSTPLRAQGLLAGDAAKALGVGVQTLHYYEREGLIAAPPRSAAGYRLYPPALVERIGFIRKAQALGLPLTEIKDVLRLAEQGTSPCGRVQAALAEKLAEVDRRLQELQSFRDDLAALVARGVDIPRAGAPAQICAIVEDASAPLAGDVAPAPLARRRIRARGLPVRAPEESWTAQVHPTDDARAASAYCTGRTPSGRSAAAAPRSAPRGGSRRRTQRRADRGTGHAEKGGPRTARTLRQNHAR